MNWDAIGPPVRQRSLRWRHVHPFRGRLRLSQIAATSARRSLWRTGFCLLLATILCNGLVSGCTEQDEYNDIPVIRFREGALGARSLSFGRPNPRPEISPDHQDQLRVHATVFERTLTSYSFELGVDSRLRFLPIAINATAKNSEIQVTVLVEGREDPAGSFRVVDPRDGSLIDEARRRALNEAVEIDLEAWTGKRVELRWSLVTRATQVADDTPSPRVGLALLDLIPKHDDSGRRRIRPDVLLICSDAHRYDYAIGSPGKQLMPVLNDLRSESVTYHRFFANATWTLPSITSVLTGLLPRYHITGVRIEDGPDEDWSPKRVLPSGQFRTGWNGHYYVFGAYPNTISTFPERLQARGYQTAAVVSNHFYSFSGLMTDGMDITFNAGAVPGGTVNRAVSDLLSILDPDLPVFLLIHYMDVHEYGKRPMPPGNMTGDELIRQRIRNYRNAVADGDQILGDVLRIWRQSRDWDRSLVAFFADHGESLGDGVGKVFGHGHNVDESLLHVPMVIKYPKALGVKPGDSNVASSLVDLAPTVLDAVGVNSDQEMLSGRSLLEKASGADEYRTLYADYQLYGAELSVVRSGKYKLVVSPEAGRAELFEVDAGALGGVFQETPIINAEAKERLEAEFMAYRDRARLETTGLQSTQEIDAAELRARLKAIGYVE